MMIVTAFVPQRSSIRLLPAVLAFGLALATAACGTGGKDAGKKDKGPPTVGYVVAQQGSAVQSVELPGRATAFRQSDVRPQVAGVLRRQFFTEGSVVRQGQPLFEIDPSLYRAAAAQAAANLESARATAESTRLQAERLKPLAALQAVSQQDYTNAAASARSAQAAVAQTAAQLETARINLRYTTVPAPITGRIGRSLFTVGALVTANQTDPLAQISQLDPIYVDIQQSASDLLALRRALASGGGVPASAQVRLTLEDGSSYGPVGTVQFAEAIVDPSTGTVTLRARFANPDGLLLPGMFVRARFAQYVNRSIILVPQQAVSRDVGGQASVFVVGRGNKAEQRAIETSRTQGPNWVVTSGVRPGDRIIVQGLANLRPGQEVKPVTADTPQRIAPPSARAAGR